jgi:hypothetical protein
MAPHQDDSAGKSSPAPNDMLIDVSDDSQGEANLDQNYVPSLVSDNSTMSVHSDETEFDDVTWDGDITPSNSTIPPTIYAATGCPKIDKSTDSQMICHPQRCPTCNTQFYEHQTCPDLVHSLKESKRLNAQLSELSAQIDTKRAQEVEISDEVKKLIMKYNAKLLELTAHHTHILS